MSELVRAIKVLAMDIPVSEMTIDGFFKIWEAEDEASTVLLLEMVMSDGGLIWAELLTMQR